MISSLEIKLHTYVCAPLFACFGSQQLSDA